MSDTCRHYRVGKCVAPGYDIGNDCNWGEADFSLCAVFKASTVRSAGGSVQAQVLASEEVLRNTSGSPSGDSPARRRDPVAPVAPTSQDPATQVGTTATASDVETAKRLVKAHRATVAVLVTSEEEQEAGRKTLAQAGSAEIRSVVAVLDDPKPPDGAPNKSDLTTVLTAIGNDGVVDVLLRHFCDTVVYATSGSQAKIVRFFVKVAAKRTAGDLVRFLDHENWSTKYSAALGLGLFSLPETQPAIQEAIKKYGDPVIKGLVQSGTAFAETFLPEEVRKEMAADRVEKARRDEYWRKMKEAEERRQAEIVREEQRASQRREELRIYAERKVTGKCVTCGKPLSFLDKLFKHDSHGPCRANRH